MKLCFSNIAWAAEEDARVYAQLQQLGFSALEIAPTRFFQRDPYSRAAEFAAVSAAVKQQYGLAMVSAQSIFNGRGENLFDETGADALLAYLERCAAFCAAGGIENLVFGCPRNRSIPEGMCAEDALPFFRKAAALTAKYGCRLALEANPPMYGTNFINTTAEALAFAEKCEGLWVNLDVGAMLDRGEDVSLLAGKTGRISHVHISEPGLAPITAHALHGELSALLRAEGYERAVSVEMKNSGTEAAFAAAQYLAEVFA